MKTKDGFGFEVLLEWQITDFSPDKSGQFSLPHSNLIQKAYEGLPSHHDLLRYIAYFFAYYHSTHECEEPAKLQTRGAAFEWLFYVMNAERKVQFT
jgi:hypothetical protein